MDDLLIGNDGGDERVGVLERAYDPLDDLIGRAGPRKRDGMRPPGLIAYLFIETRHIYAGDLGQAPHYLGAGNALLAARANSLAYLDDGLLAVAYDDRVKESAHRLGVV